MGCLHFLEVIFWSESAGTSTLVKIEKIQKSLRINYQEKMHLKYQQCITLLFLNTLGLKGIYTHIYLEMNTNKMNS